MTAVRTIASAASGALLALSAIAVVACGGSNVRTPSSTSRISPPDGADTSSSEPTASDTAVVDAGTPAPTDGGSDPSEDAERAARVDPAERERMAYERARPVFEQHCGSCHTRARGRRAALRHFGMDTYPFTGHHATTIAAEIRQVLGASGRPASMPPDNPGSVQGDDLARLLAWADAFDARVASDPPASRHMH